ncbi:MAG: cyclic nucleotide-binding domain-containing protein [Lachnospiraceae bacterium]|nr:cyclic nucleotide-binding domain-containing protein [Lachnospiraceae bacterium]
MAATEVSGDKIICSEGQALDAIHIIVAGSVRAQFPGGEIILKKGDVVGLCDVAFDSHFFTYTTLEKSSFVSFPIKTKNSILAIIKSNPDTARMMYTSMINQVFSIMAIYAKSKEACDGIYKEITRLYSDYVDLCAHNSISARSLPQFDTLAELTLEDDVNSWILPYYVSMKDFSPELKTALSAKPGYINGFLNQASIDIHSAFSVCENMSDYIRENIATFIQESRLDLFDLFLSLYARLNHDSEDSAKTLNILNEIAAYVRDKHVVNDALINERLNEVTAKANVKATVAASAETGSNADLANSLDTILEFAGVDSAVSDEFRNLIAKYKRLSDKASTDDSARKLRNEITKLFYQIYCEAFQVSIRSYSIPTIVKMFFNFGYVDEELAGPENANYLYSIAEDFRGDSEKGVYTAYEWLLAIYRKEKDPSRNEFDTDFLSYLHEQKIKGEIDAAAETSMAADPTQRILFELNNMFPLVNKVTYARLSIFCPVFSEHNVIKPLQSCIVDVNSITETIAKLEKTDYGAFYRETVYVNEKCGIPKELINVRITPDVILFPNVGTRGVMWQEIEGRKRTTPARFMISAFHMEDLNTTFTRLVGEYRWEMCKRIQGARWNDLSDPSLTSEYCDYVQFYRKNNELSAEAKEKIKNSLVKAKNSYKEMFVRDYIVWVLFEGTGSPRLNKIARGIMCTYCPFPASLREQVSKNPLFKEFIEHYEVKTQQKLHHIDNVITKIKSSGQEVPAEVTVNRAFIEGTL